MQRRYSGLRPDPRIGILGDRVSIFLKGVDETTLPVRLVTEALVVSSLSAAGGQRQQDDRQATAVHHASARASIERYASTRAFSGRRARHACHTSRAPAASPER